MARPRGSGYLDRPVSDSVPPLPTIPLDHKTRKPDEMIERSRSFRDQLQRRRSVRHFSDAAVPLEVLRNCVAAAASAPSGANKQPWTFVVVTDPELKAQVRAAAEKEEVAFYRGRAGDRWLRDLAPLGVGPDKPFLEKAPALIVVFAQRKGGDGDQHYYVNESVGIAVGFLLAALNDAGLATLTHTPSPMKFLREVLGRPDHEHPYMLIPVGLPVENCEVPDIKKKTLDEVLVER